MYADDLLEELVELKRREHEEFIPSILDYIREKSEQDESSEDGIGSSFLDKIKEVDKDKAKNLSVVFSTLSDKDLYSKFENNGEKAAKMLSSISESINNIDLDSDKIKDVSMMVDATKSIVGTAGILTLASPLLVVGAVASLALIPITWSMSKAFSVFSQDTVDDMSRGKEALNDISWSLLLFSASIAGSSALIGMSVLQNPTGIVTLFGIIGLSGLTFGLVGKFSEHINKGSLAIFGMSASLFLFSLSAKHSYENMEGVGMEGFLTLAAIMGGSALVFALAGRLAPNILMGSLAFAGMGLSLMLLSNPLKDISEIVSQNEHTIWQIPTLITGIGIPFALAGSVMPLILMGSLAFASIGGVMHILSSGIKSFVDIGDFDGDKFKHTIKSVIGGFSEIGLKDMLTIPLKLPAILSLSLGLSSIGYGLGQYKENSGWTNEDSDMFKYTITSFVDAFSMDVNWSDVKDGIDATKGLGENLKSLAKGIEAWETIDFDINRVQENVSLVLSTIPSIFADIGKMNKEGMGSSPSFLGFTFAKGNVEEGIKSTRELGQNLINLADGVKAWETIDFDIKPIQENVSLVLSTIPHVFAQVGEMNKGSQPSGFFGKLFTKGNVEEGISASKQMGETLVGLADGVKSWETMEVNLDAVVSNVEGILLALPKAFAKVGASARETSGWFSNSDHEKGAEIVASFVDPIKAISSLVSSFNDSNVDASHLESTIGSVFKSMGSVDSHIDKKDLSLIKGLSGSMKDMGKIFPEFNKGLESFQKIISNISSDTVEGFLNIAKAIEHMAKIKYVDVKLRSSNAGSIASEIIHESTKSKKPEQKAEKETTTSPTSPQKTSTQENLMVELRRLSAILEQINQNGSSGISELQEMNEKLRNGIKTIPKQGL